MISISEKHFRVVRDLAQQVREASSEQDGLLLALAGAQALLPSDLCAFNVVDLRQGCIRLVSAPGIPDLPTIELGALPDHPLINHYFTGTPEPLPCRISDLLSQSEWRRTRTYADMARPLGAHHILAAPARLQPRHGDGFVFTRRGRDFTDQERDTAALLQLVLPLGHSSPQRPGNSQDQLTEREVEVLRCLSTGASAQSIARRLGIAPPTVRKHLENIYRKLGATDRLTAVNRGREAGLLDVGRTHLLVYPQARRRKATEPARS